MVILLIYLVICKLHVQKKIINLSQFVSEALKATTIHVLQIIKGIVFYFVRLDMRMTTNFECREKMVTPSINYGYIVRLFGYL